MRAYEFLRPRSTMGLGDITLLIDDQHLGERAWQREVDMADIKEILKKIHLVRRQAMSMPSRQRFWLRDPVSGIKIGMVRYGRDRSGKIFLVNTVARDSERWDTQTPVINIPSSSAHN